MSVPYTDSEASEARQWSNRYGPPNAWTASLGTAARMIGRLLDERERLMADAMLRERGKLSASDSTAHEGDSCRGGGDCPLPDNAANHDAAPEATAPEPEPSAARRRPAGGTGDTQSFDAYRRFVGEVMNWISEATSAYAASCSSDGGRNIMADACSRCWDAFDRIAHPTIHGAAPAARARTDADRGRTDKADSQPGEGTGDTPATHATPGECTVPREGTQEPVAWGVASEKGLIYATSLSRMDAVDMQSEYACDTHIVPLYRQASDFAPPPPDNAAKAPDNAEPVAWAVCCPGDGNWSPCFFHEPHAQRHASAILGSKNVIPLYRQPPCPVCLAARSGHNFSQQNLTLTETEAETLRELRDEAAQYADEIGLTSSEIRARQRIIDGLLERMGGGE